MTETLESATSARIDFAQADGMLPEESSGGVPHGNGGCGIIPRETNVSLRLTKSAAKYYAKKARQWEEWLELKAQGMTRKEAAVRLGMGDATLWRLIQAF